MRLCPWSLALVSSIPVLGLESVCPRKGCPWPWPRIFFCVLGLEPCVLDSTSGKIYFIRSNVLRYPFIPTNPLLAAMRFISFCFLFFSLFLCALLLNHKTWKSNFRVKLLSCKSNFFFRNFLGQLHRETPKLGPQKFNFLNGSS